MITLGVIAFFIMGLTLGLIGGGGSILTVPILVYIFKQDPLQATASSLFIVGGTAAIGGIQYFFKKQIDIKTILLFSIPSFIGVYFIRKNILPAIPDTIIINSDSYITKSFIVMISFSIIMLIASLKMIRPQQVKLSEQHGSKYSLTLLFKIIFNGLIVGSIAGFVGAGGGFLIIPALTVLLNLPMRLAVGSSLIIIAIQSLLGFIFSTHLALVQWNFLFTQIAIATVGIFVGSHFNKFVAEKKLKIGFGYFVLIVSLLVITEQLNR